MIRNYLLIAYRTLARRKVHSLITIGGLSIALATSLLIGLFVFDETGFDRHHRNAERLYRMVRTESALSSGPMGPALQQRLAGIEAAARIEREEEALVRSPEGELFMSPILFADSTYFRMFSHEFILGRPTNPLPNIESAVITRTAAETWFGNVDVLGERLDLTVDGYSLPLVVTGVIEDVPRRSHFHFDIMASFEFTESSNDGMDNWTTNWLYTYVLTSPGADLNGLSDRLQPFIEEEAGVELADFRFQPVTDIHLRSGLGFEMEPQGSFQTVVSLAMVGLLILIIACANFINMFMTGARNRIREIGMRRTIGAHRGQLAGQFLGESLVSVVLAGFTGWALAALALPLFNDLSGRAWTISSITDARLMTSYLVGLLLVGVAAGVYPSVFLSSIQTVSALMGRLPRRRKGVSATTIMLGGQFAVSMFLIAATIVVGRQTDFIMERNLGFERDARLIVPLEFDLELGRDAFVRERLESISGVADVSFTNNVPGENVSDFQYRTGGTTDPDSRVSMDTWFIDESIVETLGLNVVAGRGFDEAVSTDRSGFMINESAVRAFAAAGEGDWTDPAGRQIDFMVPGSEGWQTGMTGPVIGVVQDFHYRSLHEPIGPLAFIVAPRSWDTAIIHLATDNVRGTLQAIEAELASLGSTRPFEFSFLDDTLDELYRTEIRMQNLVGVFALLAVILACLGLFANAAQAVQVRRREIGVRKVFGASVSGIARRFVGRYVILVSAAAALATPLSVVMLSRWLERFAYRIDLSADIYLLAAALTLALAVSSVLFQAVSAARTNPALVLRGD